jgi:tetratricopeptide (TPR) repeat protein
MNLRAVLAVTAVWLMAGFSAFAQGADEQYVEIYNLIQKADALRENGQPAEAVTRYKEAQQALNRFQTANPRWNNTVVSYRLGYVAMQIGALESKQTPRTETPVTTVLTPAALTNQLRELQTQIDRLRTSNSELEAKLKEAYSTRPPPSELQALARAETQINGLQRERDLLLVALEERQRGGRPDPAVTQREQQVLAEVEQKLARQIEVNQQLQQENQDLKQRLAAGGPSGNSALNEQLQAAQATITALRATNTALMAQQMLLEDRFNNLAKQASATSPEAEAELKKQLAAAQARLLVYEAKMIPYSTEELALFKTAPLSADLVNRPSATRKVQQLPAGAGPLLTKAEQALGRGDLKGAENTYRQILRQDDQNVYTLSLLASVQMEQEKWADSEATLQKTLKIDPNDPTSLYLMGRLKYQQEQYDQALDALSRSAQLLPDDARTQYFLGLTLVQKGQRASAETAFRKAVQLKPGWGAAHHALAVIYATQEPPFTELALWHYQKATANGQARDHDLEQLLERQKTEPK